MQDNVYHNHESNFNSYHSCNSSNYAEEFEEPDLKDMMNNVRSAFVKRRQTEYDTKLKIEEAMLPRIGTADKTENALTDR